LKRGRKRAFTDEQLIECANNGLRLIDAERLLGSAVYPQAKRLGLLDAFKANKPLHYKKVNYPKPVGPNALKRQERMVLALKGLVPSEIAAALSVSRATIYACMGADPELAAIAKVNMRARTKYGKRYKPALTDAQKRSRYAKWFWSKVEKRGQSDCWLFIGDHKMAYPRLTMGVENARLFGFPVSTGCRAAHTYVYRVAYCLHNGGIAHKLPVYHLCHNPRCCNPAHLRQCTKQETSSRKWWHIYETHPVTGSARPDFTHSHARSPKRDPFLTLLDSGVSAAQAARDLQVPTGTAYLWKSIHSKKANPDRSAISSPPDMENGGLESPQFTVTA